MMKEEYSLNKEGKSLVDDTTSFVSNCVFTPFLCYVRLSEGLGVLRNSAPQV